MTNDQPKTSDTPPTVTVVEPRRFLKPEVPFAVRAMTALNVLIFLAFGNPVMKFLLDLGGLALVTFVVTSEARTAVHDGWFTVLVIILVTFVWILSILMQGRIFPVLLRLANGRPAFGDLGGMPKRLLRTTLKASKGLEFHLSPGDTTLMDDFATIGQSIDEAVLRSKFVELQESEGKKDPDAVESAWQAVWESELLGYRAGDATLRDAYKAPSYAASLIPLRLTVVAGLVAPMLLAFQSIVVFLVFRALKSASAWVLVFQVGLAVSFVLSMIIYLNHVKSLQTIQLLENPAITSGQLDQLVPERLRDRASRMVGLQIVPGRVIVTPSYVSAIRNYFGGVLAVVMSYNALVQIVAVAISLAAATVVASGSRGKIAIEYGKLSIGLATIAIGIVAACYVALLLIQHVRYVGAIILGGLVTALVPLLLQYLVKGSVPSGGRAIVIAAISGFVGTFATAFGAYVTERIGASSGQPSPNVSRTTP